MGWRVTSTLSLYFHIPFCRQKCNYCDFYSITDIENTDKFINTLKKEAILRKTEEEIDTVFFGGGTPSVLNEKQFCEIADFIKQNFNLSSNCEWTIEANPESFTRKKARIWLKNGVNRLSIGIQSLNDEELKICGRIHNGKQAMSVLSNDILQEFYSINVDLIYGLPRQNEKSFSQTLKTVLEISDVKHVSLYELTIAENSVFGKNTYGFPNEETIEKIVENSRTLLNENDFERYEVSNFAKKNHRCRHNENYWNRKKYLGFGPSAHSFDGENKRFSNIGDLKKYEEELSKNSYPFQFCEELSFEQKKLEFLMLKLRTSDGFSLSEFHEKFNLDFFAENKEYIRDLVENGYMFVENGTCKLTDKGLDIADGIAAKL